MRNHVMTRLGLAALAMMTAAAMTAADARYIFYFIGDGMGLAQASTTETYLRHEKGAEAPLMMRFPVSGMISTYSASSPVTDSAAAGTALSSGLKTRNGMVGMAPDSTAVSSMAVKLHEAGFGIGLVTDVAPDDATPAAFYAHVPYRKMYYEIGCQAAGSGYEFLAGSNWRGAVDKKTGKPTDLARRFAEAGYTTVRGTAIPTGADVTKVVMLNTDSVRLSDIGFAMDSLPGSVTLPQMTLACMEHLERVTPGRFFMMVEDGHIDWGSHANDGAAVIRDVIRFNEAIAEAYRFYLEHPDETLIVVTADHETGGMSLANNYLKYNADLKLTDRQRMSKDRFNDLIESMLLARRIYGWDDMREILEEQFGMWTDIPLTEAQTKSLREAFALTFENRTADRTATYYKSYSPLVMEVFRVLNDHYGTGFTSGNHSGNMVPVYAVGAGAGLFGGFYDNTLVPAKIMEAAGMKGAL